MCSQQITTVLRTPMAVNSCRKRHLSLPAVGESEAKKIRSDINIKLNEDSCKDENIASTEGHRPEAKSGNDRALRNIVCARRSLHGKNEI